MTSLNVVVEKLDSIDYRRSKKRDPTLQDAQEQKKKMKSPQSKNIIVPQKIEIDHNKR